METFHLIAVFAILGTAFFLFVKEWLPTDLVALGAFALCIALGILEKKDVTDVFQNSAPITIGAMFVLSAALTRTGVIDWLAHLFQRLALKSELRALALLAVIVVPLSACVNNTPVVVVFLPILISFARSAELKASRLLMPLSFLAILGGTMTLVGTSTNILVSGVAQEQGMAPFGVFEITPLGLIYSLVGVTYLFVVGRKLLPNRETISSMFGADDTRDFLSTAVAQAGSPMIGKPLSDSSLWKDRSLRIFDVIRNGQRVVGPPIDNMTVQEGDLLVLKASPRGVAAVRESGELTFELGGDDGHQGKVKLVEVMVGPQSDWVGQTLVALRLRQQHGIVVAALHRRGSNLSEKFNQLPLQIGDTLLVEGPEENLNRFAAAEVDLIILNDEVERPFRKKKAPLAISAMLLVIILAAFGVPILSAALVGAVAVMLLGCVDSREAYGSIEWPILFIIYGMLGLGQAMENTGAARLIAESAAGVLEPWGPLAVLAVLYLLSSILTEVITNNAVAILLTPIAISIGHGMGVDPRAFVVAIMFGASASFATPIGYQTNTYVFGAGGYRFSDFAKVGVPLNLLLWGVAVLVIPWFWPF